MMKFQIYMALYNQEIIRGGGKPDYHRLRVCEKLHFGQTLRKKTFRIQNESQRARSRDQR